MSWLPWDLELRLNSVEFRLNEMAKQVAYLASRPIGEDMSKLHDRLKGLVTDLDNSANTVIANSTESETAFQDVITELEAVIQRLKQKIADDASQGGSTGGGSGAR
jgi:uncharacterized coiled-coil protein SlyX